jgi:hypothetical protein
VNLNKGTTSPGRSGRSKSKYCHHHSEVTDVTGESLQACFDHCTKCDHCYEKETQICSTQGHLDVWEKIVEKNKENLPAEEGI